MVVSFRWLQNLFPKPFTLPSVGGYDKNSEFVNLNGKEIDFKKNYWTNNSNTTELYTKQKKNHT